MCASKTTLLRCTPLFAPRGTHIVVKATERAKQFKAKKQISSTKILRSKIFVETLYSKFTARSRIAILR